MLFGRGDAPKGMTSTLYGGEPEPEIDMLRVSHCFGVDSKLKEYAADKHGRSARERKRDNMLYRDELSVGGRGGERETVCGGVTRQGERGRRCLSPTPV